MITISQVASAEYPAQFSVFRFGWSVRPTLIALSLNNQCIIYPSTVAYTNDHIANGTQTLALNPGKSQFSTRLEPGKTQTGAATANLE